MHDDPVRSFLTTRTRADFEASMQRERGRLLAVARRATADRQLAEDAVQEAFMGLLSARVDAQAVRSGSGWLAARVIECVRRRRRGELRRRARELTASELRRTAEIELTEAELEDVRGAVFALPATQRDAVELRYFAGLTSEEIAQTVGCARRTIDERLASARERLRRVLAPHAFAVMVARLDTTLAPPPLEVPPELVARLDALLGHPALGVVAVAAASRAPIWIAVAAAAVVAGGATALVPAFSTGAHEQHRIEESAAAPATSSSTEERVAREVAPSNETPARAVAGALAAKTLRGTSLRIRVLDPQGASVEQGELRLEPGSPQAAMVLFDLSHSKELERLAPLLDPLPLAKSNPLELEELPDAVVGVEWLAYALSPRFGTPEPARFVLQKDHSTEVRIELARARDATVRVVDAKNGKGIEGARVIDRTELERRDLSPERAEVEHAPGACRTDRNGDAPLEGIGAGSHEIEVIASGYRHGQHELGAGERALEFELERLGRGGTLIATVADSSGHPVDGVAVQCKRLGTLLEQRSTSNVSGECRFEGLEPGSWMVELDLMPWSRLCKDRGWKGPNLVVADDVDVAEGGEETVRLGFLQGHAVWALKVVNAKGNGGARTEVDLGGPAHREERTRGDGWVWFDELPPGEWSVTIDGWTYLECTLASDDVRTDRIQLGDCRVRGRVVDEGGRAVAGASVITAGAASRMIASDARGMFELGGAPAGRYRISAATTDAEGEIEVDVSSRMDEVVIPIAKR